jgi:PAS domain S-box-containing protein
MLKDSQTFSTSYLIKQLPTAVVIIDKQFKIVHVSDKWTDIFKKKGIDVYGKNLFKIYSSLSLKWKPVLQECFKGKSQPMGLQRSLDEDNNEKWYEWSGSPWYDISENLIGAIIHINDMTDAVNNELSVDKTETLLRQQSEIAKIGNWEFDILKNSLRWCSMTKAIHEVPPNYEPNIETAINFYKEGHSKNAISMAIFEATDKGTPWNLKLQITTATGKEKWVMAAGKPIHKNKELIGLIGTFQDIHEQVEADIQTKESEKLLKTLIDNLPLNVFIKDTESRKVLVNKSECDYLGVTNANDILGKNDFDLYDEEIARISRDEDLKVMETLEPILAKETLNVRKDGTETHFLTSKIPLVNDEGLANGLVGISLDITNLKEKERELRNIINVASLQNKKLLNFAHIVSHNLRSHSANFSMLLNFLVHETDEEEKNNILNMLTDASNNLLETLDNLNEVVAINTNLNVEKKLVYLGKTIVGVQKGLLGFLLNNNAKIINQVEDDVVINVEPAYLESILMNFISNSVKYKHPDRRPEIILSAERKGEYTVLSIQDNGMGIDLKKYGDKLFGMYKTFHDNKDARGIGLYISKNQIEAMNGKITVDSIVGEGTKFDIYFNEKN